MPNVAEISKTADQALAALLELSESGPMTAAELSRSLGLNRTVVHRLLTTLHQRGFIVRHNGGYAAGALLVRIAERVEPELRAAAADVMRGLSAETGETVVMHIADGTDAVVLDQVVGTRHVVRVEHRIGSRHPLAMGASGRALLAFLDESLINRLVSADNSRRLKQQLNRIRELGHSLSHDELQNGVYGLAVPILDHESNGIASLAILVPRTRSEGLTEYLPSLTEAAARIGTSLYGGADGWRSRASSSSRSKSRRK